MTRRTRNEGGYVNGPYGWAGVLVVVLLLLILLAVLGVLGK